MEPLHLVLVPLRLSLWQRPRRTLRREPCPDREDARGHPQLSSIWMQAPERPGSPRRCVRSAGEQDPPADLPRPRSEEHTSELQSLMRISYAVFCLKKKTTIQINKHRNR